MNIKLCRKVGWDIDQSHFHLDICEASQLLKFNFVHWSQTENKKLLEAVSQDLKNILGLEYLVDSCCPFQGENNATEESHRRTNPNQVRKSWKKVEGANRGYWPLCRWPNSWVANNVCLQRLGSKWNIGKHTNGSTRAVPLSSNKSYQTFTKIQWRRVIKAPSHSITISLRSETGDFNPFLSRGWHNLTLQFRQVK